MSNKSAANLLIPDIAIAALLHRIRKDLHVPSRLKRDPLVIVKSYKTVRDRELAGIICSTLAFGQVDQIMAACLRSLQPLGPRPDATLRQMSLAQIHAAWAGFQYRFCFAKDMIALMRGIQKILHTFGSLYGFFTVCDKEEDICEGVSAFALGLRSASGCIRANLLPDPHKGSGCKRLFLFLRWMVRKDQIDPGGWEKIGKHRLLVPLDTHMVRLSKELLHFTTGTQSSLRNAKKITDAFRMYDPQDPVSFDFSLTRLGIDPEKEDAKYLSTIPTI